MPRDNRKVPAGSMRTVIGGFGPYQGLPGLDDGALHEPAAAIVTGAGHSHAQLLIGLYPGFRVLALGACTSAPTPISPFSQCNRHWSHGNL